MAAKHQRHLSSLTHTAPRRILCFDRWRSGGVTEARHASRSKLRERGVPRAAVLIIPQSGVVTPRRCAVAHSNVSLDLAGVVLSAGEECHSLARRHSCCSLPALPELYETIHSLVQTVGYFFPALYLVCITIPKKQKS